MVCAWHAPRNLASQHGAKVIAERIPVPMEQLEVRRSFGGVRTALVVLIMGVSAEVRLGGLFQHTATKVGRFVAFLMAVEEINNSTELLPGNALR